MISYVFRFFLVFFVCIEASNSTELQIDDEPDFYSTPGINKNRSYELTDNLAVDMFSGTLQAHSADLVLTGIGPDIVIQRSYNSVPNILSEYSYMGPGWDIHFGRLAGGYVCADDALTITTPTLYFIKPDGAQVQVLGENLLTIDVNRDGVADEKDYKPKFITSDLWRVECRANTLVITDTRNTNYYFGPSDSAAPYVKHVVVRIEDSNKNYLSIEYALADIYAHSLDVKFSRPVMVRASDGRKVELVHSGYHLISVSDGDVEVNYIYENNHLIRVEFPEGMVWQYEYLNNTRLLSKVITPLGAQIKLAWDNVLFENKDYPVLKEKCIAEKCWNYTYERDVSTGSYPVDKTIVNTPHHTQEIYTHVSPLSIRNGEVWMAGLLKKKEIYDVSDGDYKVPVSGVSHTYECMAHPDFNYTGDSIQTFSYDWDSVPISSVNRSYINHGIVKLDDSYRRPIVKKLIEEKYNATYQYEVISHDAAGSPLYVLERGNATRYTGYTYYNWGEDKGAWIVGLPADIGVSETKSNFIGVSSIEYNKKGQIIRRVSDGAETFYTYHADGTLESSKDGVGNETFFSGYHRGVAQRIDFPDGSFITRTVDGNGRITSETNQNGIETRYAYDKLNRIVHVDMPLSVDVNVVYDFLRNGGLSKVYTKGAVREKFDYDQYGNLVEHTKNNLDSGFKLTTKARYNERNQIEFISNVNDFDKGKFYRYDPLGNLFFSSDSVGEAEKYWNGFNTTVVTDSNCNETTRHFKAYSASDQSVEKIIAPEGVVIDITYNLKGQPLTVSQNGVVREYSYNVNWMLNRYKDPEADAEYFYIYDNAGRVTTLQAGVDNKFYQVAYEFDPMGRISRESYSNMHIADQFSWELFMPDSCETSGSNACYYKRSTDTFDYAYDQAGNILSKTKATANFSWGFDGMRFWDTSTGWKYLYNDENQMQSEELQHGTRVLRLSYEYDAYGYLDRITYPGGYSVDYDPDVFGRATKAGNVVTGVEYFDQGSIKSITYGNGQIARYTLNDRLVHETYKVGAGTNLLVSKQYTYDLNRNIVSIEDFISPQKSQSMQYDGLDRLVSANGVWGASQYAYDQLSNISSKSISGRSYGYVYDYGRNRLESFDARTIQYDMYGRVINDGNNNYFYDFSNNLIKAKNISKTYDIKYEYDANNKMAKRTMAYSDSFVYGRSGKLMYEEQKNGALKRDHVYLGSHLIGYHDIKDDTYSNTIYYQPGSGAHWVQKPSIQSLVLSDDVASKDLTYFRFYDYLIVVIKGNFNDKIVVENYFNNYDFNMFFSNGEDSPKSYVANGIIVDAQDSFRRSALSFGNYENGPFDFTETKAGGAASLLRLSKRIPINWEGTYGTSYPDYIAATEKGIYSSHNNDYYYEGGYLVGYGGDDVFRSGVGSDHMVGGNGSDTYMFKENFGFDTIDESVISDGSDRIIFSAGIKPQDVLLGTNYSKNSMLVYHVPSNSLLGFKVNSIEFIEFADGVVWGKAEQQAALATPDFLGGSADRSDFGGSISGTQKNDFLVGADFASNYLSGGEGDDHLKILRGLGDGATLYNSAYGGEGNDLIEGSPYRDHLYGGDGDDVIRGGKGNDVIEGGNGSDTLHGDQGNDSIKGGYGADFLYGGDGNDTLFGDYDDDYLNGGSGSDSYYFGTLSGNKIIDNAGNFGAYENDAIFLDAETCCTEPYGKYIRSGNDLVILMTNGLIRVKDQFLYDIGTEENSTLAINAIVYNDGTTFDIQAIEARSFASAPANGDDHLVGSEESDIIDGQDGDDHIYGGPGNDVIFGGNGNNQLFGEEGDDEIHGGANNDIIKGGMGDDTLFGGDGDDWLEGNEGQDYMEGGKGDDTYVVFDAFDVVVERAGEGNDEVISMISYTLPDFVETLLLYEGMGNLSGTGNALDNILYGNSGANVLDGKEGADKMYGYEGNDTYIVDNEGDQVFEIEPELDSTNFVSGTDLVISAVSFVLGPYLDNLTLTGDHNINATGNELNNVLTGNAGNNVLDGGTGADTMAGGTGDDTYIVDVATDVVIEQANSGNDTVVSGVTYTLGNNIENLVLSGTNAISGTGNSLDNRIIGNDAANTLKGGAGNDILDGGKGNDRLEGGAGNDTYYIDSPSDVIVESASAGTDTVIADFTYTLAANLENLILTGTAAVNGTGNSAVNVITGNDADNILNGGAGADTMIGKAGDDSYIVDNTGDKVIEDAGEGIDSVSSSVTYALSANVENLTLTGSAAINGTGNAQDNVLIGNSGKNTLTGGAGNDVLDGKAGADVLVGGAGDDTYWVDNPSDTVKENAGEGTDTVFSTVTYTLSNNVENLTLTGTSAIKGTGNALDNILTGNGAANTLTGNGGHDVLNGLGGNDTLIGGAGNDTYLLGRGYASETITDNDSTSGNMDRLSFLSGISPDQIWFRKVNNNLEVSIIGTGDKATITNWYTNSRYHVEQFRTADGKTLLSGKVAAMVTAMSAFSPPASGQLTLPANYQNALLPVIHANWH